MQVYGDDFEKAICNSITPRIAEFVEGATIPKTITIVGSKYIFFKNASVY